MNNATLQTPPSQSHPPAVRCLSFDVEEYFHIEAAYGRVRRESWDQWPSRVEGAMDRLLAMLDRRGIKATFFVLGDVARRCPKLVPRVAAMGHEIASHGFNHDRLHRLNPETLKEDLRASIDLLQQQSGRTVLGYRAPTWSVTRQTAWAVDVLIESGLRYDASIFPVRHPAYGVPDAPLTPFWLTGRDGRRLLEVPPLVLEMPMGKRLAVAGGGYFRLLPMGPWLTKRGIEQAARQHRPAVLYFHPWEFDAQIPTLPLSLTGKVRTYTRLGGNLERLEKLLERSAGWMTIASFCDMLRTQADQRAAFRLT